MTHASATTGQAAHLAPILPTRVRRNYRGGMLLDSLEGAAADDGDRPESWIASTVTATNPGLPSVPGEGLTRIRLPDGSESTLSSWIAAAPETHLGASHLAARGQSLGFLAKLLDAAMRLQVQVHPTADFAQRHMGSPHGKLETYYVLAVRPGADGSIRLGFQRPPDRAEWRRIIAEQDFAAMDACFDPIIVKPGEFWLVPGGLPHAIGAGVLMVEVMEPSDLVVRCEFARDGAFVPPQARYMGRDLDFCLDVFDYSRRTVDEVRRDLRLTPTTRASGPGWKLEQLVGAERTACFEVTRLRADRRCQLPNDRRCAVITQTRGTAGVSAGGSTARLTFGASCFLSAAASAIDVVPVDAEIELVICRPVLASSQP